MLFGLEWTGRTPNLGQRERNMPVQRFLILMIVVVGMAAATIGMAYALGLDFMWLGLAALLAAFVVRRWL